MNIREVFFVLTAIRFSTKFNKSKNRETGGIKIMMPPAHVALACSASFVLIQRKLSWQKSFLLILVLAPLSHYFYDAFPHPEPSLLGVSLTYLQLGSSEWKWAIGENIAGAALALTALILVKELRNWRYILFGLLAWAPDLIQPIYVWSNSPLIGWLSYLHHTAHVPWNILLDVDPGVPASNLVWKICWSFYIVGTATPLFHLAYSKLEAERISVSLPMFGPKLP